MAGDLGLWALLTVACLNVLQGESYTSFDDDNSSVTLPDWRTDAEYVTKCDFNDDLSPLCEWASSGLLRTPAGDGGQYHLLLDDTVASDSWVGQLESDPFSMVDMESCLEFWYHLPVGHNDSGVRVLLRAGEPQTDTPVWQSPPTEDADAWRQVFIPLAQSEETGMQVLFEMVRGQPEDGEVALGKVGVRRGQCGQQCQEGREFWTDESTRCSCAGGQLSCASATCPEGSTCATATSSRSRGHFGTCVAHKEPRYTTFDGVNIRFMAPCTYVLAKTCVEGGPVADFRVEVKNEGLGSAAVSSVQQVNVELGGNQVSMLRRQFNKVMVNGMWKTLPLSMSGGAITVERRGSSVVLETDFALTVTYRASGKVLVRVPDEYSDKLCGMCGNFNHVQEDDFQQPDGSAAPDALSLGQSWQSGGAHCESPVLPSACQKSETLLEFAGEAYCGAMLVADGPFAACSSLLSKESYFSSCVLDMCATLGDPETLCDLLDTYATKCQEAGVDMPAWRNDTFCPMVCGPHSHYNSCASDCPEVCSAMDATAPCGGDVCRETCECDDGYMLSAGTCVPAQDCGCWVDGEHYEKGAVFMTGQCDRQCQCMGRGNVQCSAASCSDSEVCKVRDGVMGCERAGQATCYVYGDPHYITFDGKAYNYQGNCNYTLAKTCGPSAVQFTITTRNDLLGHAWSALDSVALEVEGLHVAVRSDKKVYVNGAEVSLPAMPIKSIFIQANDKHVHVNTSFGLSLLFDVDRRLFVQVDERYKGQMCGLCGTYSGSQFDDFVTPDGELMGRPDPFVNSWVVEDSNWNCSVSESAQPACIPELHEQGFQECRKLFGDAFQDCHMSVPPQIFVDSCMYDHCASGGGLLCPSLESYVAACQFNGVDLGDWRKDTACALSTTTTKPPATPSPDACPMSCNFDTDECGWEQLVQDSFDWWRRTGATPTDHSGPSSDHTTGSGSYMYIEGDAAVHGDSARMMSPGCPVPGTHCLRFWYHMYGMSHSMSLNVYQLVGNQARKIWSKSNNQGDSWQEATVEIKVSQPFKIILEGIRGSNAMSDMALDDFSITYGSCGGPGSSGNNGMDPTALPAVTNDNSGNPHPVCDIGCNFDKSLCSWTQLITDSFDWTWQSGSTPTLMTGPSSDHTSGSGHYMYVEGDGVHNGDTARLLSGQCGDAGPQCLQFWYHIYGTADTMGLSVYLLEGRWAQGVWTKRNNQGNMWHKAEIDLTTSGPFQIILEGRRGTTTLSDVAVDDIKLYRGSCSGINPGTPAPPNPETPVPPTVNPETPSPPTVNPGTPAPPNPETPAPPNPETPAPPQPETPAPPNPETPAPPQPETPAPPNPETPAPPQPETPAPPNPETPAPPQPETPAPPNPETPAPPNPETPAPPQPETPAPPQPETPAPPQPETPAPPQPETPAPPNPETPAPPNPETPAPPNPETPAPPNPETPAPPYPETPAPPQPETPAPPQPETTAPPNPETPAPPNPETPAPPNPETPAPPQPETPAPPNPETPAPPNPETPAPPQPETPAPPQPETPAPPNPETPAPPNPETPAPPQPETPAPPQPETPAPPNPETPAPPNPETPAPPNPETPAPPNPETPAPPTPKPTTAAPPTPKPTPSCPKNSHYTDCMPACPATCKHLHGSPHCDRDEPCVEGCVCNDGFVLKDRACVPIQKCGCQDHKGQYRYFDEVWYTDHCEQKCECEEDDDEGHVECDGDDHGNECDGDDICYMDGDGDYTCKSTDFSECTVEKDPEYRTFDDMKHDFEGYRSYVLVQSTESLPHNLPDVYVEAVNHVRSDQSEDSDEDEDSRGRDDGDDDDEDDSEEHGGRGYPRELKIRVYNHTVEFKRNRKLYVNGVSARTPLSPTAGLKVFQRSSRIYLKTDFGFSVEFNGVDKTEITLPHTYKRRVGGLCGNFDGRKKNDMMKPNGSQAKGVKEFGESWRVTEERLNIRWRRSARRGLSRF